MGDTDNHDVSTHFENVEDFIKNCWKILKFNGENLFDTFPFKLIIYLI